MCNRHSFILTRAGKVLDGIGITDSHTEIRELHGLHHTDDSVNAYEWQPPNGWPETNWLEGLTKDTEVFEPKSSHLAAMERHIKKLYPTMAGWDTGNKIKPLTKAEQHTAAMLIEASEFITVPAKTLPNGLFVPEFQVSKYPMVRGDCAIPISREDCKPWVNVSYNNSSAIAERAGLRLIRESQWLALAYDACMQDCNWTGGKVGEGELLRGIRNGNVSSAQPGKNVPADHTEQRWLTLSNGERICDLNGNIYQYVHDDIQGDERGIIARNFAKDSPSITTPPYPSRTKGMGDYSIGNWSGRALIRGGCCLSRDDAGVFGLDFVYPGGVDDLVGFRCTK